MDGRSTWDLPLSALYCSSGFSSGTENPEQVFLGDGGWNDAKSVFDRSCNGVGWSARGSGAGAGDHEASTGSGCHGPNHRPVAGMAERVQSKTFAGWKTGGLRSAEDQLGRERIRAEFVDWRNCQRRNARIDHGKEI